MDATLIAGPVPATRLVPHHSSETEMIAHLVSAVVQAGLDVDPAWIVNCYVGLKSRPLTILAGPQCSAQELLVATLTRMLAHDAWRNQMMLGHAWWAEGTGNAALFTEAQERLNSSKILALIEQASLPENSNHLYIGWLKRIGPAELAGFFSELAFQLQHKRLMRLPSFHLTEAIAWPPNFSLIGTIDTLPVGWSDGHLLSETMIIPWPPGEVRPPASRRPVAPIIPAAEQLFLCSSIRTEEAAFDKLHRLHGWRPQRMWPLVVVEDQLRRHQAMLPDCALGEAMIYVANAWSLDGEGLFDPLPARNLTIALDFAITQSLLLPAGEAIRDSAALRTRLAGVLSGQFPRSAAFLWTVQHAQAEEATEHGQTPRTRPVAVDERPRHRPFRL
jgi:hypothetical protein